jgi:hypothetical protein
LYRQLLLEMGKYLNEMEVSRRSVKIMMLEWPPSIEEWLAGTCGAWTKADQLTMSRLGMESARRNAPQRDKTRAEQLFRRMLEVSDCRSNKISTSRDAIRTIN